MPDLKIEWVSVDTVAHLGMYFGLSVWFLFGFLSKKQKDKKKLNLSDLRLYALVILVGISIGYFIELIQGNLIYRRYFDIEDVVANTFGTIFGAISYGWIGRKINID